MRALENGANDYTAIDVSYDELRILAKRVRDHPTISNHLSALHMIDGAFPDASVVDRIDTRLRCDTRIECVSFSRRSRSGCRIRNYVSSTQAWRKAVCSNVDTISRHMEGRMYREWTNEIRIYLENGATVRPYPIEVTNFRECIDMEKLAASNYPDIVVVLSSPRMFAFDADVTKLMLESCNFIVEKCEYEQMALCSVQVRWTRTSDCDRSKADRIVNRTTMAGVSK